MRAFISIHLTDSILSQIEQLQMELDQQAQGIRWIKPHQCHLTLKFLGDISQGTVNHLIENLPSIQTSVDPFEIEVGRIGQFPPRGALSVLWVGIRKGADSLQQLERSVRQVLDDTKVKYDRKPFSPHITIGRGKKGTKPVIHLSNEKQNQSLGGMTVKSLCLMESVLQKTGPIYTVLHEVLLGNPK